MAWSTTGLCHLLQCPNKRVAKIKWPVGEPMYRVAVNQKFSRIQVYKAGHKQVFPVSLHGVLCMLKSNFCAMTLGDEIITGKNQVLPSGGRQ